MMRPQQGLGLLDERGQLLTGTLMEYTVPRASTMPRLELDHTTTPTPLNRLGVKGVGEIGQVGVAAAIANALFNATGRRIRELPLAAELVMDPAPV